MAQITIYSGLIAHVDDGDAEELSRYRWYPARRRSTIYAVRYEYQQGRLVPVFMHRQITCAPKGSLVDHRDSNGLNNTRANLRICTASQNNMNQRTRRTEGKASRFKGVTWCNWTRRWGARLYKHGKSFWLGRFTSEEDAARAYDKAALEHFGEFARPNFQENP